MADLHCLTWTEILTQVLTPNLWLHSTAQKTVPIATIDTTQKHVYTVLVEIPQQHHMQSPM